MEVNFDSKVSTDSNFYAQGTRKNVSFLKYE